MRRFVSNFALEIDATFNTNRLKMLLFILVGITHIEKSFPGAFSFEGVENAESFTFIFKYLRELVFIDDIFFYSPRQRSDHRVNIYHTYKAAGDYFTAI